MQGDDNDIVIVAPVRASDAGARSTEADRPRNSSRDRAQTAMARHQHASSCIMETTTRRCNQF